MKNLFTIIGITLGLAFCITMEIKYKNRIKTDKQCYYYKPIDVEKVDTSLLKNTYKLTYILYDEKTFAPSVATRTISSSKISNVFIYVETGISPTQKHIIKTDKYCKTLSPSVQKHMIVVTNRLNGMEFVALSLKGIAIDFKSFDGNN